MRGASLGRGRAARGAVVVAFGVGTVILVASACTGREAPRPKASQDVDMKTVVMPVEGMSCSACVAQVKKALTSIDGVSDVHVNLVERNARVRFAPSKVSPDRLVAAVNGLGYRAGPATEEPAVPATGGGRGPQRRSEAR